MATQLEPSTAGSPMPFTDLRAPAPLPSSPPGYARWIALAAIIGSGALGGLIGFGTADLLGGASWAAPGAFLGAIICAIGVGIVASLTLRAMNEWDAVQHPEDKTNK